MKMMHYYMSHDEYLETLTDEEMFAIMADCYVDAAYEEEGGI